MGQDAQSVEAMEPVTGRKNPLAHPVHVGTDWIDEYCPCGQFTHAGMPPTVKVPSGQILQLDTDEDPDVETYCPPAQLLQSIAPVFAW